MARPAKDGVDYFPLDVHLDDKFKFIEIKFKLEGFAILIKLFQKIYSFG
ncbi:MAG: Lin1244/Lin1753 domain-containing protein, partial [Acutalibacteraceae bacterium]